MSDTPLPSKEQIARIAVDILRGHIPEDFWVIDTRNLPVPPFRTDTILEATASNGEMAVFAIRVRRTLEPREVPQAAEEAQALAETCKSGTAPVVAAAYLSPRSRQGLQEQGVGYIDTTGNVCIQSRWPSLYIYTQGAEQNPWPPDHSLRSLKGRGSARAMRAIIDTLPPFGVRLLAANTNTSAATISRVLELLEQEGIVTRDSRGPVQAVDWEKAIRLWAEDYDQTGSNVASTFLEPRGLPVLEKKLAETGLTYAATGAYAAQRFNPIAPAKSAALYVGDVIKAEAQLWLYKAEAGTNVVLLEPFDPVVFRGATDRGGLRCVSPSQLVVDLLTGPGREPSQGEEIITWMQENEGAWRS